MIIGNLLFVLPEISGKYCARITNICAVDSFRGDKQNDGAGAGPISHGGEVTFHEFGLAGETTSTKRAFQVIWELSLTCDKVMKVVSEELRTALPSMSIENREELDLTLRLLIAVRLNAWFLQIEHDTDPVLIVVANQSIVSVGSVGNHVWVKRTLRYLCFL